MNNSLGNILCIHYYYPPLDSPATIRNFKFSQAFASLFDQVHVISTTTTEKFAQDPKSIAENVIIHKAKTIDYRLLMGKQKSKDAHIAIEKKKGKLFHTYLNIRKSYPFNLLMAEGAFAYIYNGYRIGKQLIKKGGFTTIYSSFGPYADHYIAYLLKRKFPNLKWIADFRDLQIEPIYKNVVFKEYQIKKEASILSKADLVTTISKGFADQLIPYGRPTLAVPRGVDVRPKIKQYGKFTLAYTGSMYFDYRNPSAVFDVLQAMLEQGTIHKDDFQIVYAGRDGGQFQSYIDAHKLNEVFINRGKVSQEEASEIQNRTHLNFLITSSSPDLQGVLTGKVFEYFASQNATLCLINGVQDRVFEAIFKELSAGHITYNPEMDKDALISFILAKYEEWKRIGHVEPTIDIARLRSHYSWSGLAEKMINHIH